MDPKRSLLANIEAYIGKYLSFPNPDIIRVLALWAVSTHLFLHFDAFPYLSITADTKRAGKTRLAEILAFLCRRPRLATAMTPAALYRLIELESPTVFFDEAETLSSDATGTMRSVLNSGYRRGQTVSRASTDGSVRDYPVYCPKAFVLIGDVNDTLRDRSIVVRMERGEAPARFVYEIAKGEGFELREQVAKLTTAQAMAIEQVYMRHAGLPFLGDRDEEIWLPLFCVCEALFPDVAEDFKRIAVDLATAKTAPARRHASLKGMEDEHQEDEYAKKLLRDVYGLLGGRGHIFTADVMTGLYAIPTAPWRAFRGTGLSPIDMSNLLARFGVAPKPIRVGSSRKPGSKVARGYRRPDLHAALVRAGERPA